MTSFKSLHSRSEITKLISDIKPILENFNVPYTIVGSYRRELNFNNDLDILLTFKNNERINFNTYSSKLTNLSSNILVQGNMKSRFVINNIQIDLISCEESYYIPALMHHTGSLNENIRLRSRAKKLGYSLSEYGLKNSNSIISNFINEKDIYDFLKLKYVEPKNR